MKFINKIFLVFLIVGMSSCDNTELDLLDNPNAVNPEKASVDLLFNNVQGSLLGAQFSQYFYTAGLSRMIALGSSTYTGAFTPNALNGLWYNAYANMFPDVEALLKVANEKGLDIHAGSSNIMKALTMVTLVDLFGLVPYSDALKGTDAISPKVDSGEEVYNAALALLEESIRRLDGTVAAAPSFDTYYNGDPAAWITLAKTLQLRIALQKRLIDPDGSKTTINALIAEGDLIDDISEDFEFQFGTNRNVPNSRHNFYNNSYEANGGTYQSNYLMWLMAAEKGIEDPRIRFYYYRQDPDLTDNPANEFSCVAPAIPAHYLAVDPNMPFCTAVATKGYYGRDHGNGAGIPPDGPNRTVYGLYPGGGRYDDNTFSFTQNNGVDGALGQGIMPIMLSSWVDFMRAEAALTLGTTDNAREMLERAVRASIDKVYSFLTYVNLSTVIGTSPDGTMDVTTGDFVPGEDEINAYVDKVLELYDAAATTDDKLDVVMKEYMIALFGNGIEAFNNYRRTGMPRNMQPMIDANAGSFIRTALYPANFVNLNANATQRDVSEQVFWDNNPADFVR